MNKRNIKLWQYKRGSASAKALAESLGIKRLKLEGSRWKPREGSGALIINWGSSTLDCNRFPHTEVLNKPQAISKASNKLEAFKSLLPTGLPIPSYTENLMEARLWIGEGFKIVCRTVVNGHSGEGIVLASTVDELVDAPLYTVYFPKTYEYRVHVFREKVFFVQRKARKKEVPDEEVNWQVRNHRNGFIYAHQDVDVDDEIKTNAIMAIRTLGLDFGAVDIVVNKKGEHKILEINTACGLEGTTLQKYTEVFEEYFNERR